MVFLEKNVIAAAPICFSDPIFNGQPGKIQTQLEIKN